MNWICFVSRIRKLLVGWGKILPQKKCSPATPKCCEAAGERRGKLIRRTIRRTMNHNLTLHSLSTRRCLSVAHAQTENTEKLT